MMREGPCLLEMQGAIRVVQRIAGEMRGHA